MQNESSITLSYNGQAVKVPNHGFIAVNRNGSMVFHDQRPWELSDRWTSNWGTKRLGRCSVVNWRKSLKHTGELLNAG